MLLRLLLGAIIAVHFVLIAAMLAAACLVPFCAPWYVALPIVTYIINLTFTNTQCSLTKLENAVRRRLHMPEIRAFIKNYITG